MHKEPVVNDPKHPLLSLLIYNYSGPHLQACLDAIAQQTALDNIEAILIDDHTTDGSWDVVVNFQKKHPGLLTATRNKRPMGPLENREICFRMVRGKFYTLLTDDYAFLPEYLAKCLRTMAEDEYAAFDHVLRTADPAAPPRMAGQPLVSLIVYNYNYGRYLRECLDSAFGQTYDRIEVCFSDNASTDDSWQIALEYAERYKDKMNLTRNRKNFGAAQNLQNCRWKADGKYFLMLCSDDALAPDCVERCVKALEAEPTTAFCMVHRGIMDENSRRSEEPSFYNQSCVIPGCEQAAVYMMSSVNPSISQIMYRGTLAYDLFTNEYGSCTLWYGNRYVDFHLSCQYPMVYLKEPLLWQRMHSGSDTSFVVDNLIDVLGPYVLSYEFASIAKTYSAQKAIDRLPDSIRKIGHICMRYCAQFLCRQKEDAARRYYHMALAASPEIADDPSFKVIDEYWTATASRKSEIVEELKVAASLLTRKVSYDPPTGSIPLDE